MNKNKKDDDFSNLLIPVKDHVAGVCPRSSGCKTGTTHPLREDALPSQGDSHTLMLTQTGTIMTHQ